MIPHRVEVVVSYSGFHGSDDLFDFSWVVFGTYYYVVNQNVSVSLPSIQMRTGSTYLLVLRIRDTLSCFASEYIRMETVCPWNE